MRKLILAGLAVLTASALAVGPAVATERRDDTRTSEECKGCYDGKRPGNKLTIEPGDCGCLRGRAHNLKAGVTVTLSAAGRSASFTTNSHGNGQVFLTGLPGGTYSATISGGGSSKTKTVQVKECPKPPVTEPEKPEAPVEQPEQPKDDTPQGTATSKKRPAKRAEPNPDDSINIDEGPPELGLPPADAKVPSKWRKKFTG